MLSPSDCLDLATRPYKSVRKRWEGKREKGKAFQHMAKPERKVSCNRTERWYGGIQLSAQLTICLIFLFLKMYRVDGKRWIVHF
jgi:hypothetical protein